jgi:hypothetical protein
MSIEFVPADADTVDSDDCEQPAAANNAASATPADREAVLAAFMR